VEAAPDEDRELRALAAEWLERRHDLAIHAAAYVSVNALFIAVWALTGGVFWPLAFIVVWGIALALHAWSVFGRRPATADERIGAEAERLRSERRSG
jgi:hypothetical protein